MVVCGFAIVLCESLPDLVRRDPHCTILGRVVIGLTMEYLDSDDALLEIFVRASREHIFDGILQESAAALTSGKKGALQDSSQLGSHLLYFVF
jgi:hypothetical protein